MKADYSLQCCCPVQMCHVGKKLIFTVIVETEYDVVVWGGRGGGVEWSGCGVGRSGCGGSCRG